MRLLTILCLITLFASSCDAPRMRGDNSSSNSIEYSSFDTATPTPSSSLDNNTTTRTSEEAATPVASIPSEINHCSWSTDGSTGYTSEHLHLGKMTVCQSRIKDTDIYIQLQSNFSDSQLCLIPTYHSGSRSIYIGEPRCIYIQESGRIYKVEMLKNRTGYTNFTVTGVMMMKDKMYQYGYPYGNPYRWMMSVDAYLFCANTLDQSGDSSYCEAFSKLGQYVYNQF